MGEPKDTVTGSDGKTYLPPACILETLCGPADWSTAMTDWDTAMADHDAAVAELRDAIREVPVSRWAEPPVPGKWSAAEVALHLVLTYQHLTREQLGKTTIRVLPRPWRSWVLKQFVLPRLLAGAALPRGVRAPREVRPVGTLPSPQGAVESLGGEVQAWAEAMTRNREVPRAGATHPFFGRLPLLTMLRFATLHTRHHCRQIERAGAGLPLHGA
jgi:hypothetical protein